MAGLVSVSSAWAAVPQGHRLGSSYTADTTVHSSGGWKPEVRGLAWRAKTLVWTGGFSSRPGVGPPAGELTEPLS